ncbi:MAG: hypothetical protein WCN95_09310 [bacterium]
MKNDRVRRLAILASALCLITLGHAAAAAPGQPDASMLAESQRIVSKYKAIMNAPGGIESRNVVAAPLMGNGSLGAIFGTEPQTWPLQFRFCKSSFSKLRHDHRKGGPRPFGGIDMGVGVLKGSSWRSEQDMYTGITTATFTNSTAGMTMRTYVAATEDLLIIELTNTGKVPIEGGYGLWAMWGRGSKDKTFDVSNDIRGKVVCMTKEFLSGKEGGSHPSEIPTAASCAMRTIGQKDLGYKIGPGQKVTLAMAVKSNYDAVDHLAAVQKLVLDLDEEKVKVLEQKHRQWWKDFWSKSLIDIGEPEIEQDYYLYNYQAGSSLRDKVFPPGLFGLWTTHDDPNWCGDYHLNFDWQSQYWSMYKGNFIEQAECFHQPALDFMERGKFYAKNAQGCRGIYYPVGIWAKGMESSRQPSRGGAPMELGGVFMGQKCNVGYCIANMSMHWYHTYDLNYAKTVYPFVVEAANFWEDYLRFEPASMPEPANRGGRPPVGMIDGVAITNIPVSKLPAGRYVIYNAAIQEDHYGDFNNPMDLGLVRNLFELAMDMSKELGVDAARHEKWQHILKNLSKFATFEKDGKTVFRYSEKGTEWIDGNSVGLHHIYPAGVIGLDDDPKLLEIARNTMDAKGRPWFNDNGLNSMYPAAVRVGYDPEKLLERLRTAQGRMASGFQGSIESSTLPNTIQEMLCMSHKQVLRVFSCWPKKKDARFWTLRAEGAFLVSSALKGGTVQFVKVLSEKGRDLTMVNPWAGKGVDVYKDGKKAETLKGARVVMKTKAGETYLFVAEGAGMPTEK